MELAAMELSTGLLLVYAVVIYHIWKLIRLARADADLNLLSKRKLEPRAFENKTVWVVGASQGLGQELSVCFAAYGARLILSARNTERLQAVQQSIGSARAAVLPLDVTWPYEQLQQAVSAAQGAFLGGGIDYIVYATGASQHARVEDTAPQVVDQMLALNTTGAIHLARAALPGMLARRAGRFVLVSSMAACLPSPGQSAYACCKAGLNAYFETLATELCDRGVGVSVCCPGPIAPQQGVARSIYGPQGLITQPGKASRRSSKHMQPQRVAELVARAAYRKVDKCWIAKHPVLLLGYLNMWHPVAAFAVMKFIGPGRAAQLEKGGSGYSIGDMLKRMFKASKTI